MKFEKLIITLHVTSSCGETVNDAIATHCCAVLTNDGMITCHHYYWNTKQKASAHNTVIGCIRDSTFYQQKHVSLLFKEIDFKLFLSLTFLKIFCLNNPELQVSVYKL